MIQIRERIWKPTKNVFKQGNKNLIHSQIWIEIYRHHCS
jgi:hypothetical protein